MTVFCHGGGNSGEGCCYLANEVCPLRVEVSDGNILDSTSNLLGTILVYVTLNWPSNITEMLAQLTGVTKYACKAALDAVNDVGVSDRAAFETSWAENTEYQDVADFWESIGKARTYCPDFGPIENQCCFSESQATNDINTAGLSVQAVTIRSAI